MLTRRIKHTVGFLLLAPCVIIAFVCTLPVHAESPSYRLMGRLIYHFVIDGRNLNYRGDQMVMTCLRDGGTQTVLRTIVHSRSGKTLIEDQFPFSKKGSVIVDDGIWMKRWERHSNSVIITRSAHSNLNAKQIQYQIRLIRQNYVVKKLNNQVIANRKCYTIELIPKYHPLRIVKVWLDRSNGMPLCHQVNDMSGNTLGLTIFSNIRYVHSVPSKIFQYRFPDRLTRVNLSKSSIFHTISPICKLVKFNVTVPVRMPPGFEFEQCELMRLQSESTVCLRYTDGISNITIFESKDGVNLPSNVSFLQAGRYSDGDYIVTYHVGCMDYAVMGQNDPMDLQWVAKSLDSTFEHHYASRLISMHPKLSSAIMNLRGQGFGLDEIDAVMMISKITGDPVRSLVSLLHDGWRWESLAIRKGVNPELLSHRIYSLFSP